MPSQWETMGIGIKDDVGKKEGKEKRERQRRSVFHKKKRDKRIYSLWIKKSRRLRHHHPSQGRGWGKEKNCTLFLPFLPFLVEGRREVLTRDRQSLTRSFSFSCLSLHNIAFFFSSFLILSFLPYSLPLDSPCFFPAVSCCLLPSCICLLAVSFTWFLSWDSHWMRGRNKYFPWLTLSSFPLLFSLEWNSKHKTHGKNKCLWTSACQSHEEHDCNFRRKSTNRLSLLWFSHRIDCLGKEGSETSPESQANRVSQWDSCHQEDWTGSGWRSLSMSRNCRKHPYDSFFFIIILFFDVIQPSCSSSPRSKHVFQVNSSSSCYIFLSSLYQSHGCPSNQSV